MMELIPSEAFNSVMMMKTRMQCLAVQLKLIQKESNDSSLTMQDLVKALKFMTRNKER